MINRIKKLLSVSAAAFLCFAAVPVQTLRTDAASGAQDVKQDGLFTYEEVDGGYAVKRFIATTMTSFPSVVNGTPIVEIKDDAFYNCAGITELEIPPTVKKIGKGAFSFCTSLRKVTLPKSLTEIPDNAFIGCNSLTEIEIPDSVTRIGESAFSNCSALTAITLPDSLTEIGDAAFTCVPLETIDADGCAGFVFNNDCLMNNDKTEIYRGSAAIKGTLRIPEGIRTIKPGAFSMCYGLEEVYFPGSVTEICNNAFWDCCNVKKLDFSEGLTSIGTGAFTYNELVQTIELPISLKEIGDSAFLGCASLDHLVLQDGLESIGDKAFFGCGNLMKATVPKSVKTVGEKAFGYTIDSTGSNEIKISGFKMNVSSGSEAEKYAKSNDIDYSASDKNLRHFAFIIIAVALLLAAVVFAAVLMARGRKGAPISARKAKKEALEKEAEANYKKIVEEDEPEENTQSEKKSGGDKKVSAKKSENKEKKN
ncbi:MAG: leucine-rich repeat domain-containing protein [Ruminococcus sp.]|nr:leucine-rich repeat domain-containing protein [Ruminococcus sp.]